MRSEGPILLQVYLLASFLKLQTEDMKIISIIWSFAVLLCYTEVYACSHSSREDRPGYTQPGELSICKINLANSYHLSNSLSHLPKELREDLACAAPSSNLVAAACVLQDATEAPC